MGSAGGLAELRQSLEHGLRGPVSQPTLEILLNEQAELKVCARMHRTLQHSIPSLTCCLQCDLMRSNKQWLAVLDISCSVVQRRSHLCPMQADNILLQEH